MCGCLLFANASLKNIRRVRKVQLLFTILLLHSLNQRAYKLPLLRGKRHDKSVTFYAVYNSPLEYAEVLSTLKEYYGDDFDKSDNFGMYDEWSWRDTPDGRVQFFKYDSMFELKFSA